MRTKLSISLCVLALGIVSAGCSGSDNAANANANAATTTNPASANASVSPGTNPTLTDVPAGTDPTQNMKPQPNPGVTQPDGSVVQTEMDSNGVVTETRTFTNNKNVTKIVRTTKDGTNRTVKVYNAKGESKDLPKNKVEDAMKESGDALAAAAGWSVDKTKDAASATKDGAETVIDKTKDGAKTVSEKTVEGSKKVAEKTVEGAKKGANKVKDAVTP